MPAALPPSELSDRFERALTFAVMSLRNDRRVATPRAVARLFGVCASVLEHGGSENEAIAGLLHGSIDRHAAVQQLAAIREIFGSGVAEIVEGCSDAVSVDGIVPVRPFYDRIRAFAERLDDYARGRHPATLASSVFFVNSADTLNDARVASEQLARGEDIFGDRPGKKFGTLWSFRMLADRYLAYDDGETEPGAARHAVLARELVERVTLMAGKPVTADELLAAFAIDDDVAPREKGSLVAVERAR